MIHLQRGPAPDFWTRERAQKWTRQWIAKDCKSSRWDWFRHDNIKLNHYAREAMKPWHYGKCAFCETPLGKGEVEHFRSKTKHPLAAFIWRNLFLSCRDCNSAKGEGDHTACLKPDREDPAAYLWVNPISRKVEPKPGISEEDRQRAIKTIKLYELDRPELSNLYEAHLRGRRLSDWHTLVQAEFPFSLMVKSLLKYHNSL